MNFFKVGLIRLFGFDFTLPLGWYVVVWERYDEGRLGEIVKPKGGNSSRSDKSRETAATAESFAVFDICRFPVKFFLLLSSGKPMPHRQQYNANIARRCMYNIHQGIQIVITCGKYCLDQVGIILALKRRTYLTQQ